MVVPATDKAGPYCRVANLTFDANFPMFVSMTMSTGFASVEQKLVKDASGTYSTNMTVGTGLE